MTTNSSLKEHGWALVSVLWSMTMLSVMAAATEQLVVANHRAERRAWDRLRASAIFDAVLTQAVAGIENPNIAKRWRVDGASRHVDFDGAAVEVSVQNEAGRFDLNLIDGRTLQFLLSDTGLPIDQAEMLSDSIVTWRAPAELHALHGATDGDYENAGFAYHPRHGNFQSVDELQLVLGMTPAVYDAIRPALTVYTGRSLIDPSVASEPALLAYYEGNKPDAEAVLARRNTQQPDTDSAQIAFQPVTAPVASTWAGRAYEIQFKARLAEHIYHEDTVVMLTGDPQQPFITLNWRS